MRPTAATLSVVPPTNGSAEGLESPALTDATAKTSEPAASDGRASRASVTAAPRARHHTPPFGRATAGTPDHRTAARAVRSSAQSRSPVVGALGRRTCFMDGRSDALGVGAGEGLGLFLLPLALAQVQRDVDRD